MFLSSYLSIYEPSVVSWRTQPTQFLLPQNQVNTYIMFKLEKENM